jgi:hypothetical protein
LLYTKSWMTIDERLDRLTERHEALTQTVELIALQQQKNEILQQKNEVLMAHVLEGIDSLARIAHTHERRSTDAEAGGGSRFGVTTPYGHGSETPSWLGNTVGRKHGRGSEA